MSGDDELRDALRRSVPQPDPEYWDQIRTRLSAVGAEGDTSSDPDADGMETESTVVRLTDMQTPQNRSDSRRPALIAAAAALVLLAGLAVVVGIGNDDDSTEAALTDQSSTTGTAGQAPQSTTGTDTTVSSDTTARSTGTSQDDGSGSADPGQAMVLLADGALLAWSDGSGELMTDGVPESFPAPFVQLSIDGSVVPGAVEVADEQSQFCAPEVFAGGSNVAYRTDVDGLLMSGSGALVDQPAIETTGSDDLEQDIRRALDEAGLGDAVVDRVRAFRIDLDGDGDVDVVAQAQSGDLTQVDEDPTKYSMLLVRTVDGDEVTTGLIGDVEVPFSLGEDFYFANARDILSFVDLDRDGNVEVIIDFDGFESGAITVIEPASGETLVERSCGP